jgi:hypothetical protein
MQEALLYRQEAPGNTCMESLREPYGDKRRMPNDLKGCAVTPSLLIGG